jgi:hypothetical protein
MTQAKAQHFIPVGHLARFSASPNTVPIRRRVVHLYDKRSGSFRSAKAEKVAFENDLYTTRTPYVVGIQPEADQLIRAVFDPANKDAEIEGLKAEIEENGIAAMRAIDAWDVGLRELSEEERRPLLAYAGLLLAQHPAMMCARAGAISRRFWTAAARRGGPSVSVQAVWDELTRCMSVMAVVSDGFAAAFELNYLAWKVIRWPGRPGLVLGDVGVAACYSQKLLGIGDLWAEDAKFLLPISPTSVVVMGGFAPGVCLVEDRSGTDATREIGVMNFVSWARSRSEVYAAHRGDLDRALVSLGPVDPRADHSTQLHVRASVLPDFNVDANGDLKIIQHYESAGDDVQKRFEARLKSRNTAAPSRRDPP